MRSSHRTLLPVLPALPVVPALQGHEKVAQLTAGMVRRPTSRGHRTSPRGTQPLGVTVGTQGECEAGAGSATEWLPGACQPADAGSAFLKKKPVVILGLCLLYHPGCVVVLWPPIPCRFQIGRAWNDQVALTDQLRTIVEVTQEYACEDETPTILPMELVLVNCRVKTTGSHCDSIRRDEMPLGIPAEIVPARIKRRS